MIKLRIKNGLKYIGALLSALCGFRAIKGWTQGENCTGGTETVKFSKPVTFTGHTGVSLVNITTAETATGVTSSAISSTDLIEYTRTWVTDPVVGDVVEWRYDSLLGNYSDSSGTVTTLQDDFIGLAGTNLNVHEASPVPNDGTLWTGTGWEIDVDGASIVNVTPNGASNILINSLGLTTKLTILSLENPILATRQPSIYKVIDSQNELRLHFRKLVGQSVYSLRIAERVAGAVSTKADLTTTVDMFTKQVVVLEDDGVTLTAYFESKPNEVLSYTYNPALAGASSLRLVGSNIIGGDNISNLVQSSEVVTPMDSQTLKLFSCPDPRAEFTACQLWLKCDEGSGTVLTDFMGKTADLNIISNGTGNPWTTAGSFTAALSTGNEVYADSGSIAGFENLQVSGADQDYFLVLDVTYTIASPSGSSLFVLGDTYNNNGGYEVGLGASATKIGTHRERSGSQVSSVSTNALPSINTGRNTIVIGIDKALGRVFYWFNGIEHGSSPYVLTNNSVIATALNVGLSLGLRQKSATRTTDCIYHNVQMWKPQTRLSDIQMDLVAQELFLDPEAFPPSMKGVL